MDRLKLFEVPHKGIRNAFGQISLLAGNADYSDKETVRRLHEMGKDLCVFLSSHADDENDVVLAELEKKVPGASVHDMKDHEVIEIKQAKLEKMLDTIYEKSETGEDPAPLGAEFYFEFSRFASEYLAHMIGEEEITQKLLWDNFTDEELLGFRGRIIGNMKPEILLMTYRYIMPALDANTRAIILTMMKKGLPAELFDKMMAIGKKYLPAPDINQLINHLSTI